MLTVVRCFFQLWNPHVTTHPTGECRGHYFPIQYLAVAEETNRLFSLDAGGTIKVWELMEQHCVLSVLSKAHGIVTQIDGM
jgi:hypothetical protein